METKTEKMEEEIFIMKIAYADVGKFGGVPLHRNIPRGLITSACKTIAEGDKLLYRRLLGLCQVARKHGCAEIRFEDRRGVRGYKIMSEFSRLGVL